MTNFQYRDFPVVPEWLKNHIYKLIESNQEILNIVPEDKFEEDEKDDSLGCHYKKYHLHKYDRSLAFLDLFDTDKIVNAWAEENIIPNIPVALQIIHSGELVAPHKDNTPGDPSRSRNRALNYFFETGGNSVETAFYKPFEKYAHLTLYPGTLIPFDRIEKIESVVIEPNRWHELNTQTIHSVEQLDPSKKRIGLTITLE
jgi:hypothetical protein